MRKIFFFAPAAICLLIMAMVFPAAAAAGNDMNECKMVPFQDKNNPLADGFTCENTTVFGIATAGNYSLPFGREKTRVQKEQAQVIALQAFPDIIPDHIDLEFSEGYSYRVWKFDMYRNGTHLVQGGLDSETGMLMYYTIPSFYQKDTGSLPGPAVSMEGAWLVAEKEIRVRNGDIPVQLTGSQVTTNGNYVFDYRRIINGVPSFSNGIWIGVDSRTGKVGSYTKRWEVPEDAVAPSSVPAVSREEAIMVAEREAKACYPTSAYSFRIVSVDLRWRDIYPADKYVPKPGAIPLAWHVQFDDKTIRLTDGSQLMADAWIDAQNGTLLAMDYFHRR